MTDTTQGGPTFTPGPDKKSEPFTIDSGGGPKDGPFAGTGPLSDDSKLPKGAWEKAQGKRS